MKRFGQVGKLKPEMIETYESLHQNPWKGVLDTIQACHIQNYSIFRLGDTVFAYFEYTGEDYERDMAQMEKDPVTQEWWKHTKPCFAAYGIAETEAYYADMKQIFHT